MFLSFLEDHQKIPFLELAQIVMHADGKVDPEEAGLMEIMKKETNIKDLPPMTGRPLQEIAEVFNTKKAKYVAAFELVGLAYVNNDFASSQKEVINELFKHLNISEADLAYIENWVVRQFAMVNEVEKYWRD